MSKKFLSPAERWGYRIGTAAKLTLRFSRRVESQLTKYAQSAGIPAGSVLIRSGVLTLKLAMIFVLLLVGTWLLSALATMLLIGILLVYFWAAAQVNGRETDTGPDYLDADLYVDDYDDNGSFIGHFKTRRR